MNWICLMTSLTITVLDLGPLVRAFFHFSLMNPLVVLVNPLLVFVALGLVFLYQQESSQLVSFFRW